MGTIVFQIASLILLVLILLLIIMDNINNNSDKTYGITGKSPVFYIIAQPNDFENLDKRLDPILLVQSPFGFVWQILGAWDKEMLLLSEL